VSSHFLFFFYKRAFHVQYVRCGLGRTVWIRHLAIGRRNTRPRLEFD
jgi:hypothetical protein